MRLGGRTPVVMMAAALSLVALAWRDRVGAVLAIVAPGLTGALTEYVLKPLVNTPSLVGERAFPSGHAGGIVAVSVVAVVIVYRRWGAVAGLVLTPLTIVPVIVVSHALLRLKFHYPTDVVGGALLALVILLGTMAVLPLLAATLGLLATRRRSGAEQPAAER